MVINTPNLIKSQTNKSGSSERPYFLWACWLLANQSIRMAVCFECLLIKWRVNAVSLVRECYLLSKIKFKNTVEC